MLDSCNSYLSENNIKSYKYLGTAIKHLEDSLKSKGIDVLRISENSKLTNEDVRKLNNYYFSIANLLFDLSKYAKAIKYFKNSIEIKKTLNDKKAFHIVLILLGFHTGG